MARKNPRVDAYIAKAAPFAQPILEKLREAFLSAHPDIEEVIKWGVPHYDYKGMMAGMAAFKQHATFGFWKSPLMKDPEKLFAAAPKGSMCAVKVKSVKDLPKAAVLKAYIREAVSLNEAGVKAPARPKKTAAEKTLVVPDDFMAAMKKNRKALATFEGFSWSKRRDYVQWITEAKQEATRSRRLETAIEWLAEGKSRNWKYEKC